MRQRKLDEIITNPVPFDANVGANGALSGGGKMGHRVTAIGHDPLLGLIFGTANIATNLGTNDIKILPVPRNEAYTADKGATQVTSDQLRELVLSKSIVVEQNEDNNLYSTE